MSKSQISEDEVIQFLDKMLSISVSREQLSKPSREVVIGIYGRFLEEFGFDPGSLVHPDAMACDLVLNIEYMEPMIYPVHIFKAIEKYVPEITLQDILQPKRVRTIKILAVLCELYMRFFDIKKEWLQLQEKFKDNPHRINELEERNRELKHQLEEKSMILSSLKNKSVGLDKELSVCEEQCRRKEKAAKEREQQFRQTKSEAMKLRDQMCELDINISTAKEKQQKLADSIVRSPQKSIEITNNMERELETRKREVPIKKEQKLSLLKKLECQKAVFTSMRPSTEDITNLILMLSETDNQCEDLEKIKQTAQDIQEEIKSIEIKDKENQSAKQGWQSKRNHSARQFDRQQVNLRELNNGLQQKLKERVDATGRLEQQVKTDSQRAEVLEQQHGQLESTFEQMRDKYSQAFNRLLASQSHRRS